MDSDPDKCPECGGKIARRLSVPSSYAGSGFSTRKPSLDGPIVQGESGKLGRRVSDTEVKDFGKGIRSDSRGAPKMTPTRPKPSHLRA